MAPSRDADPPEFKLAFNSSNGPPTHVNCSLNGVALNSTEQTDVVKEVLKTHFNGTSNPDLTEVTVTVRKWLGGMYRCTVVVANSTGGIHGQGSTTLQVTGISDLILFVYHSLTLFLLFLIQLLLLQSLPVLRELLLIAF